MDLIYLDPPFNSKASYNILYKEPTGEKSQAQITAFEDTWHWTQEAERTFQEIVDTAPPVVVEMMNSFRTFVGINDVMAYLTMMAIRLIELRRVLKPTGSIYLHCDPTASHYLKILMDTIFGKKNFRNEIIWKRTSAHSRAKRWGPIHDTILFYTASDQFKWNRVFEEYDSTYIENFYKARDEHGFYQNDNLTGPGTRQGDSGKPWRGVDPTSVGRHWELPPDRALPNWFVHPSGYAQMTVQERLDILDDAGLIYHPKKGKWPRFKRYLYISEGNPVQDIITDIRPIGSNVAERLGYPTQKPVALLERIINCSSDEGDIVLDPFCGCGTTITASQQLKRKWIGIDITHLAINLIKWRIKDMFGLQPKRDYEIIGEPEDLTGARELASQNRYQFQWWALSLINARPFQDKKIGSDTGIDGLLYFQDEKNKIQKAIVQVKSGHVSVTQIRDLGHVMDREKAEIGIFITLEEPTKPMQTEAVQKGFYKSSAGKHYPKIQIKTIDELLKDNRLNIPTTHISHKKAGPQDTAKQIELDM